MAWVSKPKWEYGWVISCSYCRAGDGVYKAWVSKPERYYGWVISASY